MQIYMSILIEADTYLTAIANPEAVIYDAADASKAFFFETAYNLLGNILFF